jgi:hypothetical protein
MNLRSALAHALNNAADETLDVLQVIDSMFGAGELCSLFGHKLQERGQRLIKGLQRKVGRRRNWCWWGDRWRGTVYDCRNLSDNSVVTAIRVRRGSVVAITGGRRGKGRLRRR